LSEHDGAQRLKAVHCLLLASFLSWGCAEILGLDEPHPRPTKQAGGTSGQSTGGSSGTEAGDGGMAGTEQGGTAGGGSGTGGSGTGGTGDQGGTAGDTGGGGTGGCTVGNKRCGGETSTTPEVCDDERNWVVNDVENGGEDCPVYCEGGACTVCRDSERRCGGDQGKVPQHCEDGAWKDEPFCTHYCRNAACENPPSCRLLAPCGDTSCCSAMEVPGGTFIRDYDSVDYTNQNFRATLSSFMLDEFEVTVGRLKKFVDAYPYLALQAGDGQAEHIKGDGWQSLYPLPATVDELKAQLNCNRSTFTDDGTNERLPANCVNFFVAYAFCIWDGGRLPTEAEWNYAAAGGAEQRVYPWSDPAASLAITPDHATFNNLTDPLPPAVGSKPLGNGLWGHADLAGSLDEWTLDFYSEPYEDTQCNDCLVGTASGLRSIRGGSFDDPASYLFVSKRLNLSEHAPRFYLGFRCVHDI
jgi:formylglycine-generating enzyme